jgi:acetyl-CoA acyltransferase
MCGKTASPPPARPSEVSMLTHRSAFLALPLRTPIGKHRGALASVRTDDLVAGLLAETLLRAPALAEHLDQVVLGASNQAGEDNRNIARMALLLAGLPFEVPAVTMNRLCGSGLEAVSDAVMRIWTGDADVVLAGGVESMTRAPYVMPKSDEAFARIPPPVYDTSLGWRFPNPKLETRFQLLSMGETAENVADKWKISRAEQDAFAVNSHAKASAAARAGAFNDEIVCVKIPQKKSEPLLIQSDESPRADTTLEKLATLKPVFRKEGSVTAGNSSPLNDGASSVLVVSEAGLKALGLTPFARVVSFATVGVHPDFMGEGPIPAGQKALARAGWNPQDLDLVELNEAFAAQAIACIRGLALDEARVNVRGGAIALGHPIGSSGCRILVSLLHSMKAMGGKRGMAALCIGVGQGIAMTVEAV